MNKFHLGASAAGNHNRSYDSLSQLDPSLWGASLPAWDQPTSSGTYVLTTGVDHITVPAGEKALIIGQMGQLVNGGYEAGGTWNTGDTIVGDGAKTTFELSQNFVNQGAGPFDLVPLGVSLTNVGTLRIDSVQALGGSLNGGPLQIFDLSTSKANNTVFKNLGSVVVGNSVGADYVEANTTTALSVFDSGGDVTTYGGKNVNVQTFATFAQGDGGTENIDSNVTVGGTINGLAQYPAGTVTVTDTGSYNGTEASLASVGATVSVFGLGITGNIAVHMVDTNTSMDTADTSSTVLVNGTAGNVTVDGGANQAAVANVTVLGGVNINVDATGNVQVGAGPNLQGNPHGSVVVNDSGVGSTVNVTGGPAQTVAVTADGNVNVQGNTGSVTVNEGADGPWSVTVGEPGAIGTGLDPITGTVTVNDAGTGLVAIETAGATAVNVTGGTADGITDYVTANGLGFGALGSVALTAVAGSETITDNALTSLTVASEALAPFSVLVQDGGTQTLNMNLTNDSAPLTIQDDATAAISITLTGSAGLYLGADEASALTVGGAGAGVLSLARGDVSGGEGDPLANLRSITLTGSAGLNDGSYALQGHGSAIAADPLKNYTSLSTINAAASSGAVTVGLNVHENFTGGDGVDIVTIDGDQIGKVTGGSASSGGVSSNVLIVDNLATAFTQSLTGADVSGFGTLQTDANSGGTYDLEHVFNGIENLVVSEGPSTSETFANAGSAINLSVWASTGADQLAVSSDGLFTQGSLNLTLGVDGPYATSGVDVSASSNGILGAQTLLVNGPYQQLTVNSFGSGAGTNFARIDDATVTTLTITGTENLTLGSPIGESANHSKLTLINNDATSGLVNLSSPNNSQQSFAGLVVSSSGVVLNSYSGSSVDFTGFAESIRFDTVVLGAPTGTTVENNQLIESGTGGLVVEEGGKTAFLGSNTITSATGVLNVVLSTAGGGAYDDTATDTVTGNGPSAAIYLGNGYGDTVTLNTVNSGAVATVEVGNGNDDAISLLVGQATITYGSGVGDVVNLGENGKTVTATVTAANAATNNGTATINFLSETGNNTLNIASGASAFTTVNGDAENGNNVITGGGSTNIDLGTGANTITLTGSGTNVIKLEGGSVNNDSVTVGTGSNTITLGQTFGATASVSVGLHTGGADQMTFLGVTGEALPGNHFSGISLTGLEQGDTLTLPSFGSGLIWNGDGTAQGAQIIEPGNAQLQDYLNVATQTGNANQGVVSWFYYGGETYIVDDRSATGGNFQNGTDMVIQLTGNDSTLLQHSTLSGNTITL